MRWLLLFLVCVFPAVVSCADLAAELGDSPNEFSLALDHLRLRFGKASPEYKEFEAANRIVPISAQEQPEIYDFSLYEEIRPQTAARAAAEQQQRQHTFLAAMLHADVRHIVLQTRLTAADLRLIHFDYGRYGRREKFLLRIPDGIDTTLVRSWQFVYGDGGSSWLPEDSLDMTSFAAGGIQRARERTWQGWIRTNTLGFVSPRDAWLYAGFAGVSHVAWSVFKNTGKASNIFRCMLAASVGILAMITDESTMDDVQFVQRMYANDAALVAF